MSEDPYKLLTDSIKALNEPMNELMISHNEYMMTNLRVLNNVKLLSGFELLLNHKLNRVDPEENPESNQRVGSHGNEN